MLKLSKPICTLIEKISGATGVLYEPTRIVRKAKAEAEALIIRTKAEIDAGEIQNRSLLRLVKEEIKKQDNIESIMEKSFKNINDNAIPEKIENDWLFYFFDKCKFISDDEMQELWGKILAGETNSPGIYSKRFLNFIAELDNSDAIVIVKLLKFCCLIDGVYVSPFLNFTDETLFISYDEERHLEELGLLRNSGIVEFGFKLNNGDELIIEYYGKKLKIIKKNEDKELISLGNINFTQNAQQLFKVIFDVKELSNFNENYYKEILNQLKENENIEILEL